jgi:heptosyltransferase-2
LRIGKSGHLLVKRGGALGDFVLTLPAVAALRRAFPSLPLRLVGDPRFFPLARPDATLDQNSPALIPLYTGNPLGPEAGPFYADCAFCLAYAVDPEGHLERRLGRLVAGEILFWDPRPPAGCHITDHLLAPLRQRGLAIADPLPRFELLAAERRYALVCWEERRLRSPLVLIHPGSGGRRKCWPLDRYLALAQWCVRQGCEVLLLHGPAETDLGDLLSAEVGWRDRSLCPPGLLELASLLESAALFIGNDSGPGHLAAALGTPTLTLFGPTDPRVWRPPHPQARVVQAPDGELARLEVATVARAAGEMLGGGSRGRP